MVPVILKIGQIRQSVAALPCRTSNVLIIRGLVRDPCVQFKDQGCCHADEGFRVIVSND